MIISIRRCGLAGIVLALSVSTAPSALAQNFVTNGNFDGATNGWTFVGIGSVGYSTLDVAGSPTSGSALLTNNGGIMAVAVAQCVPGIVGGNLYDIGASVFVPSSGTTATGNAYVSYFFYDGAGCSGANSGNSTPAISTLDTWTVTKSMNVLAPVTAVSVYMELMVSKTAASGQIQANYDRAFFGPPGTTPVSLVHLEAE